MIKLSPKPTIKKRKKGWKELNNYLLFNFSSHGAHEPKILIDPSEFVMTSEEIIVEANQNGYKASKSGDLIIFE